MTDDEEKAPVDPRYAAAVKAQKEAKVIAQKTARRRPILRLVWDRDSVVP